MKANGRRRWRRRAKKLRHRGDACKFQTVAKEARRLWRGYAEDVARILPLPPPVFSPRALVGMSMGARKRAARKTTLGNERWRPGLTRYALRLMRDHFARGTWEATQRYPEIRAEYQVGQRLRPCPGCEECRGYDDGIGVIHCDGSGVIAARSQVNAGKTLAVEPAAPID